MKQIGVILINRPFILHARHAFSCILNYCRFHGIVIILVFLINQAMSRNIHSLPLVMLMFVGCFIQIKENLQLMPLKGKQYPGPSRSADGEYESGNENRLFIVFILLQSGSYKSVNE